MGHAAPGSLVYVRCLWSRLRSGWYLWPGMPLGMVLLSLACVVHDHVDVLGLCCSQELWWYLLFVLQHWALLMSEFCTIAGDILKSMAHGNSRDLWMSMAWQKCMTHASYYCKGQEATFFSHLVTADSQLRRRNTEGVCDNLYATTIPPKKYHSGQ